MYKNSYIFILPNDAPAGVRTPFGWVYVGISAVFAAIALACELPEHPDVYPIVPVSPWL